MTASVQIKRAPKPQFVYFVEESSSGLIKIGVARNPHQRLANLQTGNPQRLRLLAVKKGGREVELRYQVRFATDMTTGEWFRPSPRLLAEIERLRAKL